MRNLSLELRPTSLNQIIGNQHTISALKNHLESDVRSVGYLFSGQTGSGKTTLAEILAAELNPEQPPISINAADDTGVDSIRSLVEQSTYAPLLGRYQTYILEEAQQLTTQAQNCILRPLEDKASSTIWILTTTDPAKLIKPLRDRCLWLQLTGLNKPERLELVARTVSASGTTKDAEDILQAIEAEGLDLPREIVAAVERWVNGIPPEQAVQSLDSDPAYAEIAGLITKGHWSKAAPLLRRMKASDAKGLRQVISAYLKTSLLTNSTNGAIVSQTMKELALYTAFEGGVDMGALIGILYSHCQKMVGK